MRTLSSRAALALCALLPVAAGCWPAAPIAALAAAGGGGGGGSSGSVALSGSVITDATVFGSSLSLEREPPQNYDVLVTPTGAATTINGTANSIGAGNASGGQNIGQTEGVRFDFVEDLIGNPAGSGGYGDGTNLWGLQIPSDLVSFVQSLRVEISAQQNSSSAGRLQARPARTPIPPARPSSQML